MLDRLFWLGTTIALYALCRAWHDRRPVWWNHPQLLVWLVLMVVLIAGHVSYARYRDGTAPLVWLLGPAVVAFAVPIYDQRVLILRYWRVLAVAVTVASLASVTMSLGLAHILMLSPVLRASLVPRSVSAPFAMIIAGRLGGAPGLAACFTALSGLLGATIGAPLVRFWSIRSHFAQGAMMGMGAHGTGTARAFGWGVEQGTVAATTMTLAGLANVMAVVIWQAFVG